MGVPIQNAKDRLLTQQTGDLPQMGEALLSWFQPMRFILLTKSVVGFQNVESPGSITFQGVWQPFNARKLAMMPVGQRDWKWYTVHSDPTLNLQNDDIIVYLGEPYRVMEKWDWNLYGYKEYHVIRDYSVDVSKLVTENDIPITDEGGADIVV